MSKKKGRPEPERPVPKFDFLIPIRPDADPKDRSHYRVLAPGERLPPEYAEPMLKDIARAFVDSLEHFRVRVADIPDGRFAEVYTAWWGYFWEPKTDGEPIGPKSKLFLEVLIDILKQKVAAEGSPPRPDAPAAKKLDGRRRNRSEEN